MVWPWHFQLRTEFAADELIHGMVAHRHRQPVGDPLLDGTIRSNAFWTIQRGLQLRKLVGSQGGCSSNRNVDLHERGKTTVRVSGQPPANGAATDAQQGRGSGAGASLAARQ